MFQRPKTPEPQNLEKKTEKAQLHIKMSLAEERLDLEMTLMMEGDPYKILEQLEGKVLNTVKDYEESNNIAFAESRIWGASHVDRYNNVRYTVWSTLDDEHNKIKLNGADFRKHMLEILGQLKNIKFITTEMFDELIKNGKSKTVKDLAILKSTSSLLEAPLMSSHGASSTSDATVSKEREFKGPRG